MKPRRIRCSVVVGEAGSGAGPRGPNPRSDVRAVLFGASLCSCFLLCKLGRAAPDCRVAQQTTHEAICVWPLIQQSLQQKFSLHSCFCFVSHSFRPCHTVVLVFHCFKLLLARTCRALWTLTLSFRPETRLAAKDDGEYSRKTRDYMQPQ